MNFPSAASVRRLLRRESGFTLIEVMITASLLAIVVIAILSVADTASTIAPKDQERAQAIRDAQVGLHGMTRELRQAHDVLATQPDAMTVKVLVQGVEQQVTYRCNQPHPTEPSYRRCVREGGGSSRMVIDRVLNSDIFEYSGSPVDYVRTKIEVPAKGDLKQGLKHRVVLDDGFYMRNRNLQP